MPIPEQFIDELVARSEISDVVSSYVHLTRKGNNLWGLCPFHNEKTPSFSVSPDKQIYHCFGCGKGGGVISFIMEIENLPFPDAVRLLAQRAGLEVPDDFCALSDSSDGNFSYPLLYPSILFIVLITSSLSVVISVPHLSISILFYQQIF